MSKHYETILYEKEGNTATITLNRPPLNVINTDMMLEYLDALTIADNDPEIRVIVLTGAGRALSGGIDIKYFRHSGAAEMHDFMDLFYVKMMDRVRSLSKPIIASVHGIARAGACTLAFVCDMIIADEDATFGYPEIRNLGSPPGIHVWHVQRLVGQKKAFELLFTAEPIGATEAERIGLITKVVPNERLKEETHALASRVASMSPVALKFTRELFYRVENMDLRTAVRTVADSACLCFDFEDSREARDAFIEKRTPVFRGK